jgi:hypothetical protein
MSMERRVDAMMMMMMRDLSVHVDLNGNGDRCLQKV